MCYMGPFKTSSCSPSLRQHPSCCWTTALVLLTDSSAAGAPRPALLYCRSCFHTPKRTALQCEFWQLTQNKLINHIQLGCQPLNQGVVLLKKSKCKQRSKVMRKKERLLTVVFIGRENPGLSPFSSLQLNARVWLTFQLNKSKAYLIGDI